MYSNSCYAALVQAVQVGMVLNHVLDLCVHVWADASLVVSQLLSKLLVYTLLFYVKKEASQKDRGRCRKSD